MTPAPAQERDPGLPCQPEQALWCAALTLLLEDARAYWEDTGLKQGRWAPEYVGAQAFDDVLRAGPMLQHLCSMTGHNPQWIAECFVRGLEK